MNDNDKAQLREAIESAKRVGIVPECFQPNDDILRLIWYVVMWMQGS